MQRLEKGVVAAYRDLPLLSRAPESNRTLTEFVLVLPVVVSIRAPLALAVGIASAPQPTIYGTKASPILLNSNSLGQLCDTPPSYCNYAISP